MNPTYIAYNSNCTIKINLFDYILSKLSSSIIRRNNNSVNYDVYKHKRI